MAQTRTPLKRRKRRTRKPRDPATLVPHSRALCKLADECFIIYRGMACFACGQHLANAGHHIIPRSESAHWRHHILNLVPLCRNCHAAVTHLESARLRLQGRLARVDGRWADWCIWAAGEAFRRQQRHEKPDYAAAIQFWRDHEMSGLLIEHGRTLALDAWQDASGRDADE